METIFLLLAMFAVIKALFTASLFPGTSEKLAWGVACAVFVVMGHPFAIASSRVMLERALSGVDAIRDISAIVMIDLLLVAGFCRVISGASPPRGILLVARYIPDVFIFPALFYLHVTLFSCLPGTGFTTITAVYAAAVAASIGGGSLLLARATRESRLELVAILSLLLFSLAACCTVFHPSSVIHARPDAVDYHSLAFAVTLLLLVFLVGYAVGEVRRRVNYKIKKS
ncbi:MAG: hypothetical protein LBF09_00180 [Odoribacteraceae bacterium]|jgi:hypothetical protein|nr:hypothetical protein [Odoribacteraceae bacterium]